jgi:hypothetical protein
MLVAEWYLIIMMSTGPQGMSQQGVAIESIPMRSYEACESALRKILKNPDVIRLNKGMVCVETDGSL